MKTKRGNLSSVLMVLFLMVFGGTVSAQKALTIEEALKTSYQNNPLMKQNELLTKESSLDILASKGLHFPQISLSGSYVMMSDDITLDLNPVKDAITPLYTTLGNYGNFSDVPNTDPSTSGVLPILTDELSTTAVRSSLLEAAETLEAQDWEKVIQEQNFGMVSANIVWPLYTGGKINAANRVSKLKHKEAEQKGIQNKAKLTSELITRYYGLRLSGDVIKIREEVVKLMESHFHDAKRLFEEGMIAEAQLLHAKVYRAEAKRKLKKSRSDYYVAGRALNNSLSMEEDQDIKPISKLFYIKEMKPKQYFVEHAHQSNPQIQQVDLKKQMAHELYNVEKSDYLPTAAFAGMYDLANQDYSEYMPEWTFGVNLSWSVFDGMARGNKVKSAKYKEDRVEQIKIKAQKDITTLIEKLYQELEMCNEQIDELETSAEFAREYLKVSQKSFSEGMATSTDVTQASLALSQVQIEKLQVMYQYVTTLSRLLEASGLSHDFNNYQHLDTTIFETESKLTDNE